MKVYLAGKIRPYCWRHDIVSGLESALPRVCKQDRRIPTWPVLPKVIFKEHDYVGPFFIRTASFDEGHGQYSEDGCDCAYDSHGTLLQDEGCRESGYHGEDSHGLGTGIYHADRKLVADVCLKAIDKCDLLFAWIDQNDCYGTIFEIGYAKSAGKFVAIGGDRFFRDMWFVYNTADYVCAIDRAGICASYQLQVCLMNAPRLILRKLAETNYNDYLQTDHWKVLREQALARAAGRCQLCNGSSGLTVHHRSYENLGQEPIEDLTVLCNSCHSTFHGVNPGMGKKAYFNGDALKIAYQK